MSKSNDVVIIDLLRQINKNLSIIRYLNELQLRKVIKEELETIASTPERKKIWFLCDGTLSTNQIAEKVGISLRAVQYFLREALKAELLRIDKRGYPCRNIDWVPPEWEEVIKSIKKEREETEKELKNQGELIG